MKTLGLSKANGITDRASTQSSFFEEVGNKMDNFCDTAKLMFGGLIGPQNSHKSFWENYTSRKA